MDGVFVISTSFDTVGGMAKSVEDLALLIEYLQENGPNNVRATSDYRSVFQKDWSGLRLGFVDPDQWRLPPALVTPVEEVNLQIVSIFNVHSNMPRYNLAHSQSRNLPMRRQ